jgi:two-component system cell cycle response regulator DivK
MTEFSRPREGQNRRLLHGRPHRILIIDDDEGYGPVMRDMLRRRGYKVTLAASGDAGLLAVRRDAPDLILLDIHLPGIDGITLFKAFRKAPQTRSIPVILLTGVPLLKSLLGAAADGLKTEPVHYKPEGPEALLERVERALGPDAGLGGEASGPRAYVIGDLKFFPETGVLEIPGGSSSLNFQVVHGLLSDHLHQHRTLVRHEGEEPSTDIFGGSNRCAVWSKVGA